jgi:hypothetical protein
MSKAITPLTSEKDQNQMTRLEWLVATSGRVAETLKQITVAQREFCNGASQLNLTEHDALVQVSVKPATDSEVTIRVTVDKDAKAERLQSLGLLRTSAEEILKNLEAVELASTELDIDLPPLIDRLMNADDSATELAAALEGLHQNVETLDREVQATEGATDVPAKVTCKQVLESAGSILERARALAKELATLANSKPFLKEADDVAPPRSDGEDPDRTKVV